MKKIFTIKLTNYYYSLAMSSISPLTMDQQQSSTLNPLSSYPGPFFLDNPILTKDEFNNLSFNNFDCDWAAFTIYTTDWLKLITPLTLIQLIGHKPACLNNVGDFTNWVYVGTGTGYIRVPPNFKLPIINAIKQYGIQVSESNYYLTLISGNQNIVGYELGKIFKGI
jgi:hypothetical protein